MSTLASSTFALQAPAKDRAAARQEAPREWQAMSDAMVEEKGLLNYPQAALLLNVSTKRISELVRLGKFKRFDFMGRTYVSVRAVRERFHREMKAGRPPMPAHKRLVASLKAAAKTDKAQAKLGGYAGPYVRAKQMEGKKKSGKALREIFRSPKTKGKP